MIITIQQVGPEMLDKRAQVGLDVMLNVVMDPLHWPAIQSFRHPVRPGHGAPAPGTWLHGYTVTSTVPDRS